MSHQGVEFLGDRGGSSRGGGRGRTNGPVDLTSERVVLGGSTMEAVGAGIMGGAEMGLGVLDLAA